MLKELSKFMSKFFDDIQAAIKTIHVHHGVDSEDVTKEVNEAVAAGVAPLQSQVSCRRLSMSWRFTGVGMGNSPIRLRAARSP